MIEMKIALDAALPPKALAVVTIEFIPKLADRLKP
jgi:hypothetical protein